MLITCQDCQKEVSSEAKSCLFCGAPINDKNYSTAVLLTLLFGAIGLNFYVNNSGKALIWLFFNIAMLIISAGLFFWIIAVIQFIYFIVFVLKGKDSFNEKYNHRKIENT